jgi:hypothetical protein
MPPHLAVSEEDPWARGRATPQSSTALARCTQPYPGEEFTGPAFGLLRALLRRTQCAAFREARLQALASTSQVDQTVAAWATSVPDELLSGLQSLGRRGEAFPQGVRASAADLLSAFRTLSHAELRRERARTHRELAAWLEAVLERNMRRSVDVRMVALGPSRLLHKLWLAVFTPLCIGTILGAVGSVVGAGEPVGWQETVLPITAWLLSAFSLFPFDDRVVWVAGVGTSATLAGVLLLVS